MDLVTPDIGLLFWQTLVFLIVFGILAVFVWRPISDALRKRDEFIRESLNAAELAKQEIEVLKENNEELLKEARIERDELLREATKVASQIKEDAKNETSKITEKMINDAKASIDTEKRNALAEVKAEVARLSLEIAEKVLRKNLASDKAQKDLVQDFIKDLKNN